MPIQPDDVSHLLDEERIVRELEMPLAMRLQSERPPDAVHGGLRQSRLACDLPDAPVRAVLRFRLQRFANQPGHALVADRARAARTQLVGQPGHISRQASGPTLATRTFPQSRLPRTW